MSVTIENPGATAIRPFTIPKVPGAELQALRARIAPTGWPDPETVTDESQGVPLAMVQELTALLPGAGQGTDQRVRWRDAPGPEGRS